MKFATLIMLAGCQLTFGQARNGDLSLLQKEISKICGERWNFSMTDSNQISLASKEKALGEAPGYNFGPGEEEYTLYFRFKIVDPVDAKGADRAKLELRELRKQGNKIEHTELRGSYSYSPTNQEQRSLVELIRKAEAKVEDLPEYRFKSVYLSEEYSMDFFVPNKRDPKALQYKKDIDKLFMLLEKIGS